MKLGTEDKKKTTLLAVAGAGALVAVYVLYGELFGGPVQTPPAPPVIVTRPAPGSTPARPGGANAAVATPPANMLAAAQKVGTATQQLDPSLHMGAMQRAESLVYAGTGRNIFASGPPPAPPAPKLVQAKFPARPVAAPVYLPPAPTGPPPPPRIALKFFGTATLANGTREAFLLAGDDVFLARPGDVVQRRYRIVSIAANSITVEDIPNTNQQALPLVSN